MKNYFCFLVIFLFTNSCNVLEMAQLAETNLGDDFYNPSQLRRGLKHFWRFEEGINQTRQDRIGNSSLNDNREVPSTTGKFGNAIDCANANFPSGTDAYLASSVNDFSIDASKEYTFSFWVRFQNIIDVNVYRLFDSTAYIQFSFPSSEFLNLTVSLDGGNTMDFTNIIPGINAGQWYHIVIVARTEYNALDFYLNGYYAGGSSLTIGNTSPANINICSASGGETAFQGALDSFGIWERALEDNEVYFLYRGQSGLD